MNEQRKCLVGHDDDDGWIIGLAIALFVIIMIISIAIYGGAIIGGIYSIKNYVLAFKHNVIDSNRKPVPIE